MPRPPRNEDPDLTIKVLAHMDANNLSARKMAQLLGVSTTTLTRSLNQGRFSRKLVSQLNAELNGNCDDPVEALRKSLLILNRVDAICNELKIAVTTALKRLEAAR